MTYLESILLGLFQGVLEFFPISSSGHLIAYETIMGEQLGALSQHHKLFDAVVQIGSGCALTLFFIRQFFYGNISFLKTKPFLFLFKQLFVTSLPVVLFGALFHSYIKEYFYSPLIVAIMLVVGGAIFLIIEAKKTKIFESNAPISITAACKIGLFQVLALIPGVSRSGATIVGGRLCHLSQKEAVLFSFWIAIPVLLGAGFYDLVKTIYNTSSTHSIDLTSLFLGAISAFLMSCLIIEKAFSILIQYGLKPFGWYRIIIGTILLIYT